MAIVPPVEREDASPEVREAYEDIEANFGEVLDAFKVLGHVGLMQQINEAGS